MNQLTGISEYRDNDVLCGRGSAINNHEGNRFFQSLVKALRAEYVATAKASKPMFAIKIVEHIRGLNPPGRFLKQDPQTDLWYDIGDKKAVEKTRQALREGAPDLAKQIHETSVQVDVRALEQMISIRARSVFDDMHRSPQSKGQDCYYVPNISMPEMATTQQRYHSMYVPNNAHLQHHAYYQPPHEYQKQDSLKQYVDENPLASGVKRIFDPAEGKFVDFRFSQTSTHCSQLESSSDLSDAMRQSLASQATYLNLHNQNISSPNSEEWNVRYGGIKASSPQGHGYQHHMEHMIEHKDEVSVGDSNKFYDGYDSNQAHIHHTPLKPTTPPIIKNQLNENGNDWTSRNSLILKKMQDKINTLRSQGAEIENEMARSSAMVHHFLKELSGFNENITKEPFLPSAAAAATEDDEELSNLRSSLSSCLSINDGQMKSSMRSSLSMSEIFQSPNVQNPNAMSISSHHSQKMSLVLRQSFLSEWVDNLETEHASEVDVKALYVPDVFGSKVDKRRDVITESSQQLLEATFGSDFYGNTNTEDEHELLRNILSPKDEPLMSSIGMDMSGIWQTG